jgi:crotonobetainyl-CoA:carnitine CoA-transferase CaiB-like acyl-CoA transferase
VAAEDLFMSPGILEGLSVLELGRLVAAPYCGKLLADLGAEVIKLEEPGVGDPARRQGPFPGDVPHPERSGLFLYLNTSKRSITLSLETETGRRIFRELAGRADVLIEDCSPGELERLELDYPRLSALNPRLVVTSITPFGQTGPYREYQTHHLNLYHSSGQTSFTYSGDDEEERPPPRGGGYIGEYDSGLTAAVGTLAAVLGREASGRGQHIDVSKQEAMMCMERVDIGRLTHDVSPPSWRGQVGGMLKAKDGYFMITPAQKHQWDGLVRAMGDPDWARSDLCKDETARYANREEIQPRVMEWAAGLTRDEAYHRLQTEGTPAGPVRDVSEVLASEQAQARGFFAELKHPEAGAQVYPTAPFRFSNAPWEGRAAPLLGQHNAEVYCDELKIPGEDLARMAAAGVI